jgi:Fe-S-cluster-containing hydrogenase component 2
MQHLRGMPEDVQGVYSKTNEKVLAHCRHKLLLNMRQCVALCPTGAISHSQMDMTN